MKIEVTRTAYCPVCASNERPKTGDAYAVKGSRGFHVEFVEYNRPDMVPNGYTPHVFTLEKSENGYVLGYKVCCMDDCEVGFDIRTNPEHEDNSAKPPYLIYQNKRTPFKMKVSDWNALILDGKNLGYRLY